MNQWTFVVMDVCLKKKKTIVVFEIFDVFGQERGVCKEMVKKDFGDLFGKYWWVSWKELKESES